MKAVFADAQYWIALLNRHDGLHDAAKKASAARGAAPLMTSEMVLAEVLDFFSERGEQARSAAASLVRRLLSDSKITVVPQTSSQFSEALALYAERKDKHWSLTDCASFCIMQKAGLTEALTHDLHFEQAGFKALLR